MSCCYNTTLFPLNVYCGVSGSNNACSCGCSFGGVIANWSTIPEPGPKMWGPSESDITMLSDNTTLLSVVRMDGDAGCFSATVPPADRNASTTTYRNYAASFSTDHGITWTAPKPIEGTGCVRPKLMRLPSGTLLLTGGRLCVENTTGIFLWVNADGMAGFGTNLPGTAVWTRHSITAAHNRLWTGAPTDKFTEMVNDSSVFETLAYTSIMVTGDASAAITYNRFAYQVSALLVRCFLPCDDDWCPCSFQVHARGAHVAWFSVEVTIVC
jgi:hypothetical protein